MLTVLNGSQPRGAGFLMSRVHVTSEQLAGRDDLKMKRVKSLILYRTYSEVTSQPPLLINLGGEFCSLQHLQRQTELRLCY